jgi:MGT family glycosyltransferase
MAKMLWLNWSGGGNLPPSLGIARVLTERGNNVSFAGRPEMVGRVEAAGFRAIELTQAYTQLDRYPQGMPISRLVCYLTSPAVEDEVRGLIETEAPDVLLIDAMFPAALNAAAAYDIPSAVFFHSFLFRLREQWKETGNRFSAMRSQAGFGSLPAFEELWQRQDRIIVTTAAQFDTPADPRWTSVRHVGPVLEDEKCAAPVALPWEQSDPTPVVLVTFSTAPEQRSLEKFQRSLDALADMPVHVFATTAGVVEPEELRVPQNAFVVRYAGHDSILQRASLLITHGGHGTLMRSLKYGVPMILMPGLAHDQAPNAQMVQDWGAGIALPGDAQSDAIAAAAKTILSTPSYKHTAQRLSSVVSDLDGASNAADEVESLLNHARRVTA